MKNLILVLALLSIAPVTVAQTAKTEIEPRHLELIRTAISEKCKVNGVITNTTFTVTENRVDQGITDYAYVSDITMRVALNHSRLQIFKFRVISDYADMYDHSTRNWGAYNVSSVTSADTNCR